MKAPAAPRAKLREGRAVATTLCVHGNQVADRAQFAEEATGEESPRRIWPPWYNLMTGHRDGSTTTYTNITVPNDNAG